MPRGENTLHLPGGCCGGAHTGLIPRRVDALPGARRVWSVHNPALHCGVPVPGPLDVGRAGVLLHLTSLPDAPDLGPAASAFADFLAAAACTVWQMLPVGPTHPEDGSPYNAVSAMAGDPELVSLA